MGQRMVDTLAYALQKDIDELSKSELCHGHLSTNLRPTAEAEAVAQYIGCDITTGAIALDICSRDQDQTCYSRNKNTYKASRHNGELFIFKPVVGGIDNLGQDGLVSNQKQSKGLASKGIQSFVTPSDCLRDIVGAVYAGELIPRTPPKELIILRDSKKQNIDYSDTRAIVRSRRKLQSYNEHLMTSNISGADLSEMVRIFNNSSFKEGGRSYALWQNMPQEDRAKILIDGSPMIELDYSTMHPTMLYTRKGLATPLDCYDIDGVDRSKIKLALLILINATGARKATFALAARLYSAANKAASVSKDEDIPKEYTSEAAQIIKAVKKLHKPIAEFFHSGVGLELQNLDARIAECVWWWMHQKGVIVLPVHDSFVVRIQHADLLESIMREASHKIIGRAIDVTRKDA